MLWPAPCQLAQVGPAVPQSVSIHPVWLVLPSLIALLAVAICTWLAWRTRVLTRAIRQLQDGKHTALPGAFGFLPRFRVRTMLVAFTMTIGVLGMFAAEFNRARRQGAALDEMSAAGATDLGYGTHYRLGVLGESQTAGLIAAWVHPHFGARLTHLALNFEAYGGNSDARQPHGNTLRSIGTLHDLEVLEIRNSRLSTDHIEAIATLSKLRQLSLRGCRLPANAVTRLSGLKQLHTLLLSDCLLTGDDLAEIEELKALEHLSLDGNLLEDHDLQRINGLKALAVLDLSGNDITNNGLIELIPLANLSDLLLCDTSIDSSCVETLASMPSLRYVNFYRSSWSTITEATKGLTRIRGEERIKFDWEYPNTSDDSWEFYDNRPEDPTYRYTGGWGCVGSGGGQF